MSEYSNHLLSGSIGSEAEALATVKEYPEAVAYLPDQFMTEDVLYTALSLKVETFKLVDEQYYTDKLIDRLLFDFPITIESIPKSLINRDVFIRQIKKDGRWLRHIPIEFRDVDLCLLAINNNIDAHEFVPPVAQTSKYLDQLIVIDPTKVSQVSVENRSPLIMLKLLEDNYEILKWIPSEYRTPEMYEVALKNSIKAVEFFSDEYYNNSKTIQKIASHPYFEETTQYSPNLVRLKLCEFLLNKDFEKYFPRMPEKVLSLEICIKAISIKTELISCVPKYLRIKGKLWEAVLSKDESYLTVIPPDEKTAPIEVLEKKIIATGQISKYTKLFHTQPAKQLEENSRK